MEYGGPGSKATASTIHSSLQVPVLVSSSSHMYKSLWPRPQSQWQNQKTETGAAAPAGLPLPCTVAEPVCSLHLDPRPYPLALALLSFHPPLSTLPQSPHSTFSRPRPSPRLKFPLSCCFLSHSFPPPLLPLSSPEPRGLLARRGNQIAPFCPWYEQLPAGPEPITPRGVLLRH